jgi:hypothetical protein
MLLDSKQDCIAHRCLVLGNQDVSANCHSHRAGQNETTGSCHSDEHALSLVKGLRGRISRVHWSGAPWV